MPPTLCRRAILLGFAMTLTACSAPSTPTPNPTAEAGGLVRRRNEGYSLIYKLMSDESDVDKILIIKKADAPIADLIKQIAAAAGLAKKQLEDFAKADKQMELDVPDLPKVEQDSRDLATKQETKLLLGSSGPTFELRLLFTQAQALGYGEQLCRALAVYEENADRKTFLEALAGRCADLQKQVLAHLSVKS